MGGIDSGFIVLYDDAPTGEELEETRYEDPADDPRQRWICLHCLIERHPEIGRGLDIAREHRVADLDDGGEWIVGDLSRLEE
jgi:hypothetical protein